MSSALDHGPAEAIEAAGRLLSTPGGLALPSLLAVFGTDVLLFAQPARAPDPSIRIVVSRSR